ncbi:hypothetical protein [Chryseobacterium sp. SC28]|uniref:hypothetical protein n=1 Tax=Chryseobacterium sp. SC28 TaxID=2268028 RepID=UPI000F6537D0|nr:hypothetical protein [Chryseobacterium sp. SC28]RRQ46685.1 hypothetical protein DTW91_04190 [Chryseobacterium sp. SC28]
MFPNVDRKKSAKKKNKSNGSELAKIRDRKWGVAFGNHLFFLTENTLRGRTGGDEFVLGNGRMTGGGSWLHIEYVFDAILHSTGRNQNT